MGAIQEYYFDLLKDFPHEELGLSESAMRYWISIQAFRTLVKKAHELGFKLDAKMVLKIMRKTLEIVMYMSDEEKNGRVYYIRTMQRMIRNVERHIEQHPDRF